MINESYPWYLLHLETLHEDFKDYVIARLIAKLNEESVKPEHMEYSQDHLERMLEIKLKYKFKNGKTCWSFIK